MLLSRPFRRRRGGAKSQLPPFPIIVPADAVGWTATLYDLLGDPVMIGTSPDAQEIAWGYAQYPALPEVPVEWVRALGTEIDAHAFDGLMLAKRIVRKAPSVFVGADGSAVIVTPKATLTRRPGITPRWRRGIHISVAEFRCMRHAVGELAQMTIADSRDPAAWGKPDRSVQELAQAAMDSLNRHVAERYGGIDEVDLPGFPHLGFTDSAIAESKRVAGEVIRRAARH